MCVLLFAAVFVFLLVSSLGIRVESRVRVNSRPEDDPPRVETCCSNFNLHNYICVDGNFYVIYNKLNDIHTTG